MALWWPASAAATFPGVNGASAWQDGAGFVSSATPDGAFQRTLTDPGSTPAWSADGSLIAFTALTPTGQPEIYTIAPDRTQLTNTGYAAFPAWSPDDSKLAVARFDNANGWDICPAARPCPLDVHASTSGCSLHGVRSAARRAPPRTEPSAMDVPAGMARDSGP